MKNSVLLFTAFLLSFSSSFAQDIPQSQVPSLVINTFKQTFPKAFDVEWEMKGEEYQAEFQTGFSTDHQAWFDKTGKLMRHEEDISSGDLPNPIKVVIHKNYPGFRIDDAEKITVAGVPTYRVELNSYSVEWIIVFDKESRELEKRAD